MSNLDLWRSRLELQLSIINEDEECVKIPPFWGIIRRWRTIQSRVIDFFPLVSMENRIRTDFDPFRDAIGRQYIDQEMNVKRKNFYNWTRDSEKVIVQEWAYLATLLGPEFHCSERQRLPLPPGPLPGNSCFRGTRFSAILQTGGQIHSPESVRGSWLTNEGRSRSRKQL